MSRWDGIRTSTGRWGAQGGAVSHPALHAASLIRWHGQTGEQGPGSLCVAIRAVDLNFELIGKIVVMKFPFTSHSFFFLAAVEGIARGGGAGEGQA